MPAKLEADTDGVPVGVSSRLRRKVGCVASLCALLLVAAGALATRAEPGEAHLPQADKILVKKSARLMQLVRGRRVLRTYRVALGQNPLGPKRRQGDKRTPEGIYVIDARNVHSRFHRSLRISYPNRTDRERARRRGVSPGGDIMIHGLGRERRKWGSDHVEADWTDGCIAVTDAEILEIFELVPIGTYVEIRP